MYASCGAIKTYERLEKCVMIAYAIQILNMNEYLMAQVVFQSIYTIWVEGIYNWCTAGVQVNWQKVTDSPWNTKKLQLELTAFGKSTEYIQSEEERSKRSIRAPWKGPELSVSWKYNRVHDILRLQKHAWWCRNILNALQICLSQFVSVI